MVAAILPAVVRDHRSRDALADARLRTASLALKAGDWILVTEFDNQTGEAVLDGTIRAAIERELEYSDYVRVAQRDRIVDAPDPKFGNMLLEQFGGANVCPRGPYT